MRKIMSVLLVGLMLSGVASSAIAFTFMAEPSCGEWVAEANQFNMHGNKMWLAGYLSGLASGTGKDALEGNDADSLFLWMDNYCKASPLDKVGSSANKLFRELSKRKGIKL